jgi:hypothetical protein
MQKPLQLSEQHKQLQQEIPQIIESTIAARILNAVGSCIQRFTQQSQPVPWYVSALVLAATVILPQTLIALVLKDPQQVIGKGLFWSVTVPVVSLVIPLHYLSARHLLLRIRDHILPDMKDENDWDRLKLFLDQLAGWRLALARAIMISLLWTVIAVSIFSSLNNGPIRVSYAFDVWLFGFFGMGIGLPYLSWFVRLPNQLKHFQYRLYQLNPAQSEVVAHISNLSTPAFLAMAFVLAIGTVAAGLIEVFNWVVPVIILSFWIPLITNFINTQAAVNKIVESGKWQTLNEIQEQIHALKNDSGIRSTADLESINKLMELHDKVYNAKNTRLRITSVLEFLNQLLLPLLAFLISNYAVVLKLFNVVP